MVLTKYTDKYTKEFKHWVDSLFTEQPPEETTDRCCLTLSNKEISLLYINKQLDKPEVFAYDRLHFEEFANIPLMLSANLARQQLPAVKTDWLLTPDYYQLFLIESLPVAAAEYNDALTWRIRSLINFPIEEAIIDSFRLPPKKGSSEAMIAAIVAKRKELVTLVDTLKKCDLPPGVIDIPELAMRNLTALYENDEKSTAFIYFYANLALLTITREKTLYFTRRIPLSITDNHIDYEQLSLELLRYFDYFQTQWRYPSPNRILIAAETHNIATITSKLSEYLLSPVESLRVPSALSNQTSLSTLEKNDLLLLGAALRKEPPYATSRN